MYLIFNCILSFGIFLNANDRRVRQSHLGRANEKMMLSFVVSFNVNNRRAKLIHWGSNEKKYYHLVCPLTQTSIGADEAIGDEK